MKVYTPTTFAEEVEHGLVVPRTIVNWILSGKIIGYKGVTQVEQSPTGRYKIIVGEPVSIIDRQFEEIMMRRKMKKVS